MTSWLRQHGLLVAAFSVGGSAVGVTDTVGPAGRPAIVAAIVAVAAILVAGVVEIVKLRTLYCQSTACAAADRAKIRQARAWGRERRRTYRKLVAMVESLQHVEAMASLVSGFETCFPPPPDGDQAAAQVDVPAQAAPPTAARMAQETAPQRVPAHGPGGR